MPLMPKVEDTMLSKILLYKEAVEFNANLFK
ncbi:MAG: hypothetical protein [Bacteriophage sp.]|nr:MAG: hypothetical protein [Bacteriophage sp.]